MAKITVEQIKAFACEEYVDRFRAAFGDEVEVGEENLQDWMADLAYTAAHGLLSSEGYREFIDRRAAVGSHRGDPSLQCSACLLNWKLFIELYNRENDGAVPEVRNGIEDPLA